MKTTILFILIFIQFNAFTQTPTVSPTPFVKPVAPKSENVTDWAVLEGLDIKDKKVSSTLTKILKTKIKLLGFMVPLDYDNKFIKEFLLIPTPYNCAHVPPPAQNQMVVVKMKKGTKGKYYWGPVYTSGILTLPAANKNSQELPGFEMEGQEVTEYKPEEGPVKVHNN